MSFSYGRGTLQRAYLCHLVNIYHKWLRYLLGKHSTYLTSHRGHRDLGVVYKGNNTSVFFVAG